MNRHYVFLSFWVLAVLIASCASKKQSAAVDEVSQLYFVQGENSLALTGTYYEVTLERAHFSIQYYQHAYRSDTKEFYAGRITAVQSLEPLGLLEVGMKLEDTPCFGPGSGLAGGKEGYDFLYFANYGCHYVDYEEGELSRAKKVGQGHGMERLSFDAKGIWIDGESWSMEESPLDSFYLVTVIDRNLNAFIDEGELTKVKVVLR